MAVEDFTTYTEVDPNSRITVTSTRVTAAGIARDEAAYVYKDKGAAFFSGNFIHDFTMFMDSTGGSTTGWQYFWTLTNLVNSTLDIETAADDYLTVVGVRYASVWTIFISEFNGASQLTDSDTTMAYDTVYYGRIERDEFVGTYGTFTLRVYSDSDRTVLVTAITINLRKNADLRYIYPVTSRNDTDVDTSSGYTENLDLSPTLIGGISGTVKDENGNPIDCSTYPVFVTAHAVGSTGAAAAFMTVSTINGIFSLSGLTTGAKYRLSGEYVGTYTPTGAVDIADSYIATAT